MRQLTRATKAMAMTGRPYGATIIAPKLRIRIPSSVPETHRSGRRVNSRSSNSTTFAIRRRNEEILNKRPPRVCDPSHLQSGTFAHTSAEVKDRS